MKVLHFISKLDEAALEVAAALATHASREDAHLENVLWAPLLPPGSPLPNAGRRAERLSRVRAAMALRGFIVREGVDVVHCHDAGAVTVMSLLAMPGRVPPIVLSAYAPLPARAPRKPLKDALARSFLWCARRNVAAVIAPSMFARGLIVARGAFEPERVVAVPFGVEPPSGGPPARHGDAPLRVTLLPVDLKPARRRASHRYFLQAAATVLRQAARTVFVVACEAADAAPLRSTLAEMGLADKVTLAPSSALDDVIAASDIAVLPTGDFQGVRALVHAMAGGKAIVAPDLRGVREFLEQERTGLLIRPSDSQALADSLLRLAAGAAERARLADAAAAAARQRFTAARMAREIAEVYSRLAAAVAG